MISYRIMQAKDIDAGLALCRGAGWNQLERDWQLFLQLSPGNCCVALNGEEVAGTVTTISYENKFSWIGMVLVNQANQRMGIGTGLLNEALKILSNEETVKLDATPAGREVYLKLNFIDEYRLGRMIGVADKNILQASKARLIKKEDIAAVAKYDSKMFGADRYSMLEWLWNRSPESAFVIEEQNKIKGFCMGRPGHNLHQIGPVVADNPGIAKDILSAALLNHASLPVIVDAMYLHPEWKAWLEVIGFKEQRPFIRMYRGSNRYPGIPEKQFAITGPEFG